MEIVKKFNELTLKEYFYFIDNYKKYKDFNTLGLYRSIVENEKLSVEEKIELRSYANNIFQKTFDFLQLKDPITFVAVSTLGQALTSADEAQIWKDLKKNQQKILSEKNIKHRNFGTYSKHNCPYEDCVWNGVMIRQGSSLAWSNIHFFSDKNNYHQKQKSERQKSERKNEKQIVAKELLGE